MNEKIKPAYESACKKYTLPSFEEMDSEFEISLIEHEQFLIRELAKRIFDKIDFFSKVCEQILQPDTNSVAQINEYRFLDEKEKAELFEFYKKLMRLHRELIALSTENDDAKTGQFIGTTLVTQWKEIKGIVIKTTKKLSDSWTKSSESSYKADYLG